MMKPNLIGHENRLLRRTLSDYGQVAPVNRRAAQTASQLQNTNSTTKGISIGDNPNADLVERMVVENFDMSKATPDQIARHEEGLRLAEGGQYVAAPGVNTARGTTTAQQTTYANQAAGLNTTFTSKTGEDIYAQEGVTSASGDGALQQAAIERLRAAGKTDAEIRTLMSSPDFMDNIRTTMSNTGLGGTERQSSVLTAAQAQTILANSRNPAQRAAAQKFIDDNVAGIKGYDSVAQYDENGRITGYSNVENKGKTEENQRRERERLALEESNRLKSQENADKLKKFTAGIDTTQLDQTKAQLDNLMGSIANLSPDLQAAVLPSLLSLQNSNNDITKQVNDMIGAQPSDEDIEAQYGGVEEYIKSEDQKYKDLIAKNFETSKEIATYNRDMLEIDKKITDHDAAVAEQRQLAANVDGEKKLRRQLNRLGIQTDVSGLTYLQTEIQKGVDALENLKTANNLVSLKAQLAIGEGYRLNVKQAMETYEGNYLNITSQTTERLQAIKNSISTAKGDRTAAIIEAKKWGLEQKAVNDRELRTTISNANITMIDNVAKEKTESRLRESAALDKIDYLLKNYPRASVADAIKQLGKDVTSFDVQALIDNPTLSEIKKAASSYSGGGGGSYSSYLPTGMQAPPKPSITFDEFTNRKLSQAETTAMKSLSPEARAKLMFENAEAWEREYKATYLAGPTAAAVSSATADLTSQFGEKVVQAAQLVLDGTYTGTDPIGKVAKAMGVPTEQVATALTKLRQSGAVADSAILSPKQQTDRDKIIAQIKSDPFYTVWNGSKSAVSRIQTAIGDSGGADGLSDIMAINAFQNGIVDPGATVKEGDVSLMQTAIAWADLVQLDYWKEKISDGDKLPPEMRQKMLQLATATRDAYAADFQNETVPKVNSLIQQNGLPPTVLDEYTGQSAGLAPTVSPDVKSFVDSLPLQ
jgi:hypothetical protein